MKAKLKKQGDKYLLELDAELVEAVRFEPGTELHVSAHGDTLLVATGHDPQREQRFRQALDDTNANYGQMLKRLAE